MPNNATRSLNSGSLAMSPGAFEPFVRRLAPILDETVERLSTARFRSDPIGGPEYSRATSIMSSAYKRHGQILGHALIERLKECARLEVWSEDNFKLSLASAEAVRKGLPLHAYRGIDLPYGDSLQTVRVDAIVFDRVSGLLRSYNVKRGNGSYDAGKRRLMLDELLRVQTLLRAYGEDVGLSVIKAEAYAIFYYGLFSVPSPYSLSREHLDEHFQFEVAAAVEAVNESFKARLHALIKGY